MRGRQLQWRKQALLYSGCPLPQHLVIVRFYPAADAFPAKFLRAQSSIGGQVLTCRPISEEIADRPSQFFMLAGWHQYPIYSVTNNCTESGDVRGDNRPAGCQRLQEDHALALTSGIRRAKNV